VDSPEINLTMFPTGELALHPDEPLAVIDDEIVRG
jgi:hypothetical protein